MIFAEVTNIRQDNNNDFSCSNDIVPHDLARKIILSLPVRNSQTA